MTKKKHYLPYGHLKGNARRASQGTNKTLILKARVGSYAYGTSIPSSDMDFKAVYVQHESDILGFQYQEQINVSKDEVHYEVRRFLELLKTANPTMLELLFIPSDCLVALSPAFEIIQTVREKFITQKCFDSFAGYAIGQIKKARGLNKKMNWESEQMKRKTALDFCYAYAEGKMMPLAQYLDWFGQYEKSCGLAALDHLENGYGLYFDSTRRLGYRGILSEDGNDVRISSIPKGKRAETIITFNKNAYSQHCKQYREYEEWLHNRNTERYVETAHHGTRIDGKNLLHCRRLLDMALEIATTGSFSVRRPNAEELLKIRRGEVELDAIIEKAEEDIATLNSLKSASELPREVDADFCHFLLLEVRKYCKRNK